MMKRQLKKVVAIVALLLMGSLNFAFVECPAADDPNGTYFPHESDCSKFYQCSNGEAIEMQCPMGFEWNVALNMCDFSESAGCGAGTGKRIAYYIAHCSGTSSVTTTVYKDINGRITGTVKVGPWGISGNAGIGYVTSSSTTNTESWSFDAQGNSCPTSTSGTCTPVNPCRQ